MQPKNEGCIKNLYSDTPSYCIQTKTAIRREGFCLGKFTGKRYLFKTGSQVRPTPSFLNILWSTSLSITVQCT